MAAQPTAAAGATQGAAPAAAAPAAARPVAVHKSTAIIPGWSRPLSSQALTIECQKISQPARSASAKETYGVMELEVMKFVAYCGGLTIRLRVDDLQHGPVDRYVIWHDAVALCIMLMEHSAASLQHSAQLCCLLHISIAVLGLFAGHCPNVHWGLCFCTQHPPTPKLTLQYHLGLGSHAPVSCACQRGCNMQPRWRHRQRAGLA